MGRATANSFRIGEWRVNPASGEISRNGETIRLELRTMRLLMCLSERAGQAVSIDDLLTQVWPEVTVTPDSVYQAIAGLRRVLGDDPKHPTYIETIPRLGYRMVAAVTSPADRPAPRVGNRLRSVAAAAVCLALVATVLVARRIATRPSAARSTQPSIGVLPFLDLTEKMKEEEFADGVTEELIDRLNKIPGLRVPPPTASFYFKNKRRSIPEIAKALDVAYVLDGSTRKSGDRLRVAARLIRADDGVIVWSDTFDRPWSDVLTVQDDIAVQTAKGVAAAINVGVEK